MPFFNQNRIQNLLNETIRGYLRATLGVKSNSEIKRVHFFPIYTLCEFTEEKVVSQICARVKNKTSFITFDVSNIEASGVTLVEFIDYIIKYGAKQIKKPAGLLEII
jgi:hypothetical protein